MIIRRILFNRLQLNRKLDLLILQFISRGIIDDILSDSHLFLCRNIMHNEGARGFPLPSLHIYSMACYLDTLDNNWFSQLLLLLSEDAAIQ